MGYVGQKLEDLWEREEQIQSEYDYDYGEEPTNEHADFCNDNKFLQELELLMDTIVLHCEARVEEASKTFWQNYGGRL